MPRKILMLLAFGLFACGEPQTVWMPPDSPNKGAKQEKVETPKAAVLAVGKLPDPPSASKPGPVPAAKLVGADACVARINEYRRTKGLHPLIRWGDGERCADQEAKDDASRSKAHASFGRCNEMAQNECPGWPVTAGQEATLNQCLAMMWNEGPGGGHYENMVKSYARVACGFYTGPDGKLWAIQNFAP